MLRRWLTVLLAVVTALVAASPASASMPLGPQTRVGAFELAAHTLVGPAAARTVGSRQAKSLAKPARASDPRLRWKGRPYLEVAGGVYDIRARWWSPRLGAFLSADQFGYADVNSTLWSWGNQNPVRWNDPSGHCPQCPGAAFGAAAGLGYGIANTNWNGSALDIAADLAFATATGAFLGSGLGEIAAAASGGAAILGSLLADDSGQIGSGGGNPEVQAAEQAAEGAVCSASASNIASAPQSATALAKQLASQAQLGEMTAGTGRPIAGSGADAVFRDAARIADTYGGNAADWAKMSSSGFTAADGTAFATHWVPERYDRSAVRPRRAPS